jgi:hypothetical protein
MSRSCRNAEGDETLGGIWEKIWREWIDSLTNYPEFFLPRHNQGYYSPVQPRVQKYKLKTCPHCSRPLPATYIRFRGHRGRGEEEEEEELSGTKPQKEPRSR